MKDFITICIDCSINKFCNELHEQKRTILNTENTEAHEK